PPPTITTAMARRLRRLIMPLLRAPLTISHTGRGGHVWPAVLPHTERHDHARSGEQATSRRWSRRHGEPQQCPWRGRRNHDRLLAVHAGRTSHWDAAGS